MSVTKMFNLTLAGAVVAIAVWAFTDQAGALMVALYLLGMATALAALHERKMTEVEEEPQAPVPVRRSDTPLYDQIVEEHKAAQR